VYAEVCPVWGYWQAGDIIRDGVVKDAARGLDVDKIQLGDPGMLEVSMASSKLANQCGTAAQYKSEVGRRRLRIRGLRGTQGQALVHPSTGCSLLVRNLDPLSAGPPGLYHSMLFTMKTT
jgi:hypothetical protein